VAGEISVIENVERFGPQIYAYVLAQGERALQERRDIVDRTAAAQFRPTTTPLMTGRSVVAPVSPLLLAPVM